MNRTTELIKHKFNDLIYNTGRIENIVTTIPETHNIINGIFDGDPDAYKVRVVLGLKHGYQYIMEHDLSVNLKNIELLNKIIGVSKNQSAEIRLGSIRDDIVIVNSGIKSYRIDIPQRRQVKKDINNIVKGNDDVVVKASRLIAYLIHHQLFFDSNKRTSILSGNLLLKNHDAGLIYVKDEKMNNFFNCIDEMFQENNESILSDFIKNECYDDIDNYDFDDKPYHKDDINDIERVKNSMKKIRMKCRSKDILNIDNRIVIFRLQGEYRYLEFNFENSSRSIRLIKDDEHIYSL